MELLTILFIVWLHVFADFVLQTHTMSINKGTSIKWLTIHIVTYTIPWFIFGWVYALVNAVLHWITDFATSRLNHKLANEGRNREFFMVVGLDQGIHLTTLFVTYHWLFG